MSPQTTPDRQKRWPGADSEAIAYLESRGFKSTRQWTWIPPTPGHTLSERDEDAIVYLIEEWDWGGLTEAEARS